MFDIVKFMVFIIMTKLKQKLKGTRLTLLCKSSAQVSRTTTVQLFTVIWVGTDSNVLIYNVNTADMIASARTMLQYY